MSGIVLISDTHFSNRSAFSKQLQNPVFHGCNNRLHEIAKIFSKAVDYAVKNDCEALIVLGDVFHERGIIQIPVYNAVHTLLGDAYDKQLRVLLYPGNHDMVDLRAMHGSSGLHSLAAFEDRCYLFSEPSSYELDSFRFGIIPFSSNKEDIIHQSKALFEKTAKQNILLMHHSFYGAESGPHEWRMPHELRPEEVYSEWDKIISGHLHKHQTVGQVMYVGAPIQHDLGERTYIPGFLHVTPDGKVKQIENVESPRFLKLTAFSEKDIPDTDDYCLITWEGDSASLTSLRDNENTNILLEIKSEVNSISRTSMNSNDSIEDMFNKYLVAKGRQDKELLNFGMELYRGANENIRS